MKPSGAGVTAKSCVPRERRRPRAARTNRPIRTAPRSGSMACGKSKGRSGRRRSHAWQARPHDLPVAPERGAGQSFAAVGITILQMRSYYSTC